MKTCETCKNYIPDHCDLDDHYIGTFRDQPNNCRSFGKKKKIEPTNELVQKGGKK